MVSFSLQNEMTGKLNLDMLATIHSVTFMYSDAFLALVLPWKTSGSVRKHCVRTAGMSAIVHKNGSICLVHQQIAYICSMQCSFS